MFFAQSKKANRNLIFRIRLRIHLRNLVLRVRPHVHVRLRVRPHVRLRNLLRSKLLLELVGERQHSVLAELEYKLVQELEWEPNVEIKQNK